VRASRGVPVTLTDIVSAYASLVTEGFDQPYLDGYGLAPQKSGESAVGCAGRGFPIGW
jgi:hypothetical protein